MTDPVQAFCRLMKGVMTPKLQVRLAWIQLVITLIGWPISTWAAMVGYLDEPPIVLSLSWWAILVTCLGYISASEANEQVSGEDGGE